MDLDDELVRALLGWVGVPYCWGAGDLAGAPQVDPTVASSWPRGLHGGRGIDCSGLAQWALWRSGQARPSAWQDLRARDLHDLCAPVLEARLRPADLVFYAEAGRPVHHVTVVLGRGQVLHASGDSRTDGSSPTRAVQVRHLGACGRVVRLGRLEGAWR
jgi:cell wall-associated NlpC family hydrolase